MATLSAAGGREQLKIRRNDRAIFVGATGTGKTTLAKALLWGQAHVAVLDPKRTFVLPADWPGGSTTTSDRKTVLDWDKPQTIVYRPGPDEISNPLENMQWWFWWLFERGHTLGFVDEVQVVVNQTRAGRGHVACIQLGRERGVGMWHATQRPASVPIIVFDQAEHLFSFRLRHPDDRRRIADYSDPATEDRPATGYGFWYWNDRQQKLRYFNKANVQKVL